MDIKVIDLFCGGGGFSRGFHLAGIEISLAVDNAWHCYLTYTYNFKDTIFLYKDIRELSSYEIKEYIGEVDVVIGSPPCEAFTAASPKRMKNPLDRLYVDPRGRLTLEFIRIISNLKPQIFVMENVPQLIEGPLKNAIIKEFEKAGYDFIYFNILKAENLGTPSRRTRLFVSNIQIPKPKEKKIITVLEAIKDLPNPRFPNPYYNHVFIPISEKMEKEICKLRWGQALKYFKDSKGRSLGNYERLYPFDVAPSIKGQSRFIHPFDNRLLTVREQARLMGFPDNHVFLGSKDQQFDMVGEAVPPTVSYYIAKYILKLLC